MDSLQIQHAIDQIELNQAILKEELLNRTDDRSVELEEELEEATDQVEKLEEEKEELEMNVSDLKSIIKEAISKLSDADPVSDAEKDLIEEVIEILSE